MTTETTQGVRITVTSAYQPGYSHAEEGHFVFAYFIRIENNSEHTVQLLRRHWYIFDASGQMREVEGEGVVGRQPILEPGETHEYVSSCAFQSGIGKMMGTYLMERVRDGRRFRVNIPEFTMVVPYRLN